MNYYEVLGVSRNSTPEEIKKAYRRLASAVHPDREGGDPEQMSRINKAYECLMDEHRREEYDRTGGESNPNPIDFRIQQKVMEMFAIVLNSGASNMIVERARQQTHEHLRQTKSLRFGILQEKAKCEKLIKKVRVKNNNRQRNIFNMLIDQQLAKMAKDLAHVDDDIILLNGAIEVLENFESIEEQPEQPAEQKRVRGPVKL